MARRPTRTRAFANDAAHLSMEPLLPRYTVLRETYTVERLLGGGAFGEVYLARHKYLGMQALKVFRPTVIQPEKEAELFNEAFVLAKITHQNVVRIYDANVFKYRDKTLPYIVMEYIPGETLKQYVARVGLLSQDQAVGFQLGICTGLAQAHRLTPPVVHRDIKPDNILIQVIQNQPIPKVVDFGLARHVNATTRLIQAAGTLAYMAPEGFWGIESPASDVFSAGVIFYWLVTGQEPFPTPEGYDLSSRQGVKDALLLSRKNLPPLPSKIKPDLDPAIDSLIEKALSFEAKQRYVDAFEFGEVLREFQARQLEQQKEPEVRESGNKSDGTADLIARAMELSRQYGTIQEAADLLESAIKKNPALGQRYGALVQRWRQGLML